MGTSLAEYIIYFYSGQTTFRSIFACYKHKLCIPVQKLSLQLVKLCRHLYLNSDFMFLHRSLHTKYMYVKMVPVAYTTFKHCFKKARESNTMLSILLYT